MQVKKVNFVLFASLLPILAGCSIREPSHSKNVTGIFGMRTTHAANDDIDYPKTVIVIKSSLKPARLWLPGSSVETRTTGPEVFTYLSVRFKVDRTYDRVIAKLRRLEGFSVETLTFQQSTEIASASIPSVHRHPDSKHEETITIKLSPPPRGFYQLVVMGEVDGSIPSNSLVSRFLQYNQHEFREAGLD